MAARDASAAVVDLRTLAEQWGAGGDDESTTTSALVAAADGGTSTLGMGSSVEDMAAEIAEKVKEGVARVRGRAEETCR